MSQAGCRTIIHFNAKPMNKTPLSRIMTMLLLLTALCGGVRSQPYSVTIRTTVIPPVSPFFDQMLSSITGGRLIVVVSGGIPTECPLHQTRRRYAPTPFLPLIPQPQHLLPTSPTDQSAARACPHPEQRPFRTVSVTYSPTT